MFSLIAFIREALGSIAGALIAILPHSPFRATIEAWEPPEALGFLNWFLPIGQLLQIVAVWLVAMAAYYAISALLRWVKIIGG